MSALKKDQLETRGGGKEEEKEEVVEIDIFKDIKRANSKLNIL